MNATALPRHPWLVAAAGVLVALACAVWPVTIWALTLAVFGVPHALVELRWVGQRYGTSAAAPRVIAVLSLLVALRLCAIPAGWPPATTCAVELALGTLLVGCVLPRDAGPGVRQRVLAIALFALLASAAVHAPIDSLLTLALVHNLTPIGFVADRLRDRDLAATARTRWIALALLGGAGLPLWLASGTASAWLGLADARTTGADLAAAATLGIGLYDGLGAFVPRWLPAERAVDVLRAAAFLQVLHYVAVLRVLPRLEPRPRDVAAPPGARGFAMLVVVLGVLFAIAFAIDFRDAKANYGALAAAHVWLEFPALLLALAPRPRALRP